MPSTSAAGPGSATPQSIIDAFFSFTRTQILLSAVELDLFTRIDEGHHTVEQLARATHASRRGLGMLLNVLVAEKYLLRHGDRFELSDTARIFLSRRSPRSMATLVLHARQIMPNWMQLTEIVLTGRPAVEIESRQDEGNFFAQFVEGLYGLNAAAAEAAAKSVLSSSDRKPMRVLDIGAGSGVWGIAFARQQPSARVTALDRPAVIEAVTRKVVARERVASQFDYLEGDFQTIDLGEGMYDVAILGHICHSEGRDGTRKLLARISRALAPGGRLVIAEFLCDEARSTAEFPLTFALNMLVHTAAGDTFTYGELTEMLEEAGFGNVTGVMIPGPSPLIVGRKQAAQERAA